MDVVELTRRLVEAPSENPPGDERAVAAVVESVCEELGLPQPRRVADLEHRPNLLIDIEFGPGGRWLAMSGHLDTKPVGTGAWDSDALTAVQHGDVLIGRGVADMKGAVAAMLLAAAQSDHLDSGRLTLVLTADEEHGATHGAQFLADVEPMPWDAIVIGEPGGIHSDWDRLHLGSRGIANVAITVTTEQGHSGIRDEIGLISATDVAARLLIALNDEFRPSYSDSTGALASEPLVNAGVRVEGGIGYGVLPGRARLEVECRLAPGMNADTYLDELAAFLGAHLQPQTSIDIDVEIELEAWLPAAGSQTEHPIVAIAQSAVASATGRQPDLAMFPATTDATWFRTATEVPILPAYGPGLLSQAHTRNESLRIDSLSHTVPIYRDLIARFCAEETV